MLSIDNHLSLHIHVVCSSRSAHSLICAWDIESCCNKECNYSEEQSYSKVEKKFFIWPSTWSPRYSDMALLASQPTQGAEKRKASVSTYKVSKVRSSDYSCAFTGNGHAQRGTGSQPRRWGPWQWHLHSHVHGRRREAVCDRDLHVVLPRRRAVMEILQHIFLNILICESVTFQE